ncbi:hypothetical protein LPJ73_000597 [Coemansia sp. RSA 2703]|nr:hypothetical protein LPJ73_000597 [Coemansia sp. RSA 2703]KAJ2378011.1 hypothetical protein IW150_001050 [Coemansia sp. RSA 2607]KAJ2398125.1 hypothetical protein GGI05_000272 [Coemansia sp. RSA 2603]
MPPLKPRRGGVRANATKATTSRGDNNNDENEDLSHQIATPLKKRPSKSNGSSSDYEAPPDTLVVARRTRHVYTEDSPEPSPSVAAAKRGRGRGRARGRGQSQSRGRGRGRGSKSTTSRSRGRANDESEDEGGEDEDKVNGDEKNGLLFDDDQQGTVSENEDDVLVATPTRKRAGRQSLLVSPTRESSRLAAAAREVDNVDTEKNSVFSSSNGRKRRAAAREPEGEDDEQPTDGRSIKRRGKPPKLSLTPASAALDSDSEEAAPGPSTPSRRTRGTRSASHALKTKAEILKNTVDVYVDIVSPSKFERSRSLIETQGSARSDTLARAKRAIQPLDLSSPEALSSSEGDGNKWRKKYEELVLLRQTKPEKEYAEFKRGAEARFNASDMVISKLRKEVAEAKRQADQLREKSKRTQSEGIDEYEAGLKSRSKSDAKGKERGEKEKELEKQVARLQESVDALTQDVLVKEETIAKLEKHRKLTETATDYNLREKLRMMQELSGLSIEDVVAEDQGVSYVCRQTGSNAEATYILTSMDDVPQEYQYSPCGSTTLLEALPEYLKEPMAFVKDASHMFFWRMCDHLHQQTSDSVDAVPEGAAADGAGRQSQPQPQPNGSSSNSNNNSGL